MEAIKIGPLVIPALALRKGQLLHLHIPWPLDMDVDVPPGDITITPSITLLPSITVWDPAWVTDIVKGMEEWIKSITAFSADAVKSVVEGMSDWIANIASGVVDAAMPAIIEAVFNAVEPYLNGLAEEFYEQQGKE